MQTVKNFVYGKDPITSEINITPIESQVNEYLENHPGYSVATFSTLNASGYKEAFVVFNIREERKFEPRQEKQDRPDKKAKPQ